LGVHFTSTDEGLSGTGTRKRSGFNQMMKDAELGLFDLIIIKEISRFARNTVDSLTNIRRLKALGIGIEFVSGTKMNTLKVDEFTITLFSSLAQKESENTSERVKWGQLRQMERGVAFGGVALGYNKSKGTLTVNEEEAKIVRRIFSKYCDEGKGINAISKELEEEGVKTKTGNAKWTSGAVSWILKNEKYAGDLIQRKTYTVDCLTHEKKRNSGEVEFVTQRNHHEPIIDRATFDKAQAELARRGELAKERAKYTTRYPFSGKIKCGLCGKSFVSRRRANRKTVLAWKCHNGFRYGAVKTTAQGETVGCDNPSISDELLRRVFLHSLRDVAKNKEAVIARVEKAVLSAVSETGKNAKSDAALKRGIANIEKKQDVLLDARLGNEITKEEFRKKKDALGAELETLRARLADSEKKQEFISRQSDLIEKIKTSIREMAGAEVFSGDVCKEVLDKIVVHNRSEYRVFFKGLADPVTHQDAWASSSAQRNDQPRFHYR